MVVDGFAYVAHMFSQGFSVIDVRDPAHPKPGAYIPCPANTWILHLQAAEDLLLVRVHDRLWWTGGRWAYISAMLDGFSDYIFLTLDMADPAEPTVAGRWWIPGMHTAVGETPVWDDQAWRYSCHHGSRGTPDLIAHRTWSPPFGGGTHNALPLPGRELMVVVDEAVMERQADGVKPIWIFDIREPGNPVSIATMPVPDEADYLAEGSRFGPHNVHENRPGTWVSETEIFATYNNAGVRIYGIGDPFVDAQGLLYATDQNGGLSILERT